MTDVKLIGPTDCWTIQDATFRPPLHERRERIATAAMQGMLSNSDLKGSTEGFAQVAVQLADALIAELDKPEKDKT